MAVTVHQAAANALKVWLAAQLGAGFNVEPQWPDPDTALQLGVTIVPIGPRRDFEIFSEDDAIVVASSVVSATQMLYTFSVRACAQTFQLDTWAPDPFKRDDLDARLDVALNAGFQPTGLAGFAPVSGSLVCPLGDGWTGNVDFIFDGPELLDDGSAVRVSEYRSSRRGEAWFMLTGQAQTARMVTATLKERLREADLAVQAARSTLTTIAQVGGGPAVTVSGAPIVAGSYVIRIILGGAIGVATFQYSLDGGSTWSATRTTATTYVLGSAPGDPGNVGGNATTGITAAFTAGTYVVATTYSFTATAQPYGQASTNNAGVDAYAL